MAITTELTIIVPTLNEEGTIASLLDLISRQQDVELELLICDGGSSDGTRDAARQAGAKAHFPVEVIKATPGRGPQMNAGAAQAQGEYLLFLHADSSYANPRALRTALDLLRREEITGGCQRIAGRFRLLFDRWDASPSLPYFFFESKARLDRPGCSHGDQGFMLSKPFYLEIGPFDGSIPMLAETRFAEAVRNRGKWLLFPDTISTSSRRFQKEGLYERQLLNAVIMNFAALGWDDFFRMLPAIYGDNPCHGRLDLKGILGKIDSMIASLPLKKRLSLWLETGRYVRANSWQIPFYFDVRRNFRRGLPPGFGMTPLLELHDRHIEQMIDNSAFRSLAAIITWLWFQFVKMRPG